MPCEYAGELKLKIPLEDILNYVFCKPRSIEGCEVPIVPAYVCEKCEECPVYIMLKRNGKNSNGNGK